VAATTADLARRLAVLRDCVGRECRQEPALSVLVRRTCPEARVEVEVGGRDVGAVSGARFLVDGLPVSTDVEMPYQLDLPIGQKQVQLRVHIVLADGREATRDRTLAACP